MLTAPCYLRVGESCVDLKIAKVDLKMPKKSPREETHHGCSISYAVFAKDKGQINITPICRKLVGGKTVICTYLCMKKYIAYMYAYKSRLDQLVKSWF